MKFFGNIAHQRPQETFQGYPKAIEVIVDSLGSSDHTLVCVALETVGYIATTTAGKHTLHKQGKCSKVQSNFITNLCQWTCVFPNRHKTTKIITSMYMCKYTKII